MLSWPRGSERQIESRRILPLLKTMSAVLDRTAESVTQRTPAAEGGLAVLLGRLKVRQGLTPQVGWRAVVSLICVAANLAPAVPAGAREKQEAGVTQVYGYVTKVESNRITIMSLMGNAKLLPLTTQEDFTEKVAKGSKVTAWYFEQGDAYILKWLEYPLENSFTSSRSIRGRVRRAIILPNSTVADADPLYDATAQFLENNLKWRFATRTLVADIRQGKTSTASAAEAVNPSNSPGNPAKGQTDLIPLIAREAKVNAVLEISVEQVAADVKRSVAVWDGVDEPISAPKGFLASAKSFVTPQKDTIPATTVVFKLWDSRGKLMWSNRRGFALLALREGKELRERSLTEVFQNTDNVQRWLQMVFRSIVPASSPPNRTKP
jgi:hypothetical protein